MTDTTTDLITRLREGDGPDRFLDADICLFFKYPNGMADNADPVRTYGKHGKLEFRYRVGGNSFTGFAPNLTASFDACLALVYRALPRWELELIIPPASKHSRDTCGAELVLFDGEQIASFRTEHEDLCRAILIPTIQAHEAQQADDDISEKMKEKSP